MHRSLLVAVAALHAFAEATGVVVESLRGVPQGWKKLRDADPSASMVLRVAMEQPHKQLFEQTLYDISTPSNPKYGQHLQQDELRRLMMPREESTDAVLAWLREAGISESNILDKGDWIKFRLTVSEAEELLDTKFAVYGHDGSDAERIRALHYSVPEDVRPHISFVAPIIRFGDVRAQRSTLSGIFDIDMATPPPPPSFGALSALELNVTACNASITPDCLRALYKVGNSIADPTQNAILGINGFLNYLAKHDQWKKFVAQYAPYARCQDFDVVQINGGIIDQNDITHDDGEANLDVQYAVALAYKTPVEFYSTGGTAPLVPDLDQPDPNNSGNEPYLDYLDYLLALPDAQLPLTLSTSYGENEQSVPAPYVEKACQMFGQLGARGVSVIFSSGDTGVGQACQTNDGKNTTRFLPIFPAACPYVTSVGATRYVEPEVAVSFSSGGFSDIFDRPAYQDSAVAGYLAQLGDRWDGLYNPAGRGFPDVATQGVNYWIYDRDNAGRASGTSASAPAFAGIISLLNNARLRAKQPPLGFLNPWLYSVGVSGFTDIVHGGSTGCTGRDGYSGLPTPFVPYASWNATTGWDPVTGLGTPLFDTLLELSTPGMIMPVYGQNQLRR